MEQKRLVCKMTTTKEESIKQIEDAADSLRKQINNHMRDYPQDAEMLKYFFTQICLFLAQRP